MSLFGDSFQIQFTSANLVSGTTNQFQSNFTSGIRFDDKWEFAITSLNMFNSVRNVMSTWGNNKFSYVWVDGTTVNITLPDGYYSINDLGNYLEGVMQSQKHYLVYTDPSTGSVSNVYFLLLETNATYYGASLTSLAMSTTLYPSASGYAVPSGASWSVPVSATNPQFVVPAGAAFNNLSFGSLIGFPSASYPSASSYGSNYTFISGFTGGASGGTSSGAFIPEISPVQTIIIQSNLAVNPYQTTPQVLAAFSMSGIPYGGNLSQSASSFLWQPVYPNVTANFCQLNFIDQAGRSILTLDPNLTVVLQFRKKRQAM